MDFISGRIILCLLLHVSESPAHPGASKPNPASQVFSSRLPRAATVSSNDTSSKKPSLAHLAKASLSLTSTAPFLAPSFITAYNYFIYLLTNIFPPSSSVHPPRLNTLGGQRTYPPRSLPCSPAPVCAWLRRYSIHRDLPRLTMGLPPDKPTIS